MSRKISQKTIDAVKENVTITDAFEWLGAKVVRRGNKNMAFCLFCDDATSRHPACSLSDDVGLFHCFRCGTSGNMFQAVQKSEGYNFPEAVEALANQFNIPIEYIESSDPEADSRRKRLISALEATQNEFIAQREDKHYQDFLKQRQITEAEAEKFELGLSLYSEADKLVDKLLQEYSKEELVAAGLCIIGDNDKIIFRFKNRIMFPIKTATGALVGFGGRDITGKSPAKYKNSPESELFKKRNLLYGMNVAKFSMSREKKVIVCEGYMDTIALQCQGFGYAVGAMGTALTLQSLNKLSTFADIIYLSLDSDKAGIAAAMRTVDTMPIDFKSSIRVISIPEVECINEEEVKKVSPNKWREYAYKQVPIDPANPSGATIEKPVEYPIMVPMAKDPDEFFNQEGHSKDEFIKIIDNAADLFLFCVREIIKPFVFDLEQQESRDTPDMSEVSNIKIKAKKELHRWMSKAYPKANVYQRQAIAAYVIKALKLVETEETLDNEWRDAAFRSGRVARNQNNNKNRLATPDDVVKAFSSNKTIEEDKLISTLFYHPESRAEIKARIDDVMMVFTSDVRRKIFEKLDTAYSKGISPEKAKDDLDDNEIKEFARIVMEEENAETLSAETINDICDSAKIHALKNEIERESNAASPDVMKIIDLKMKLSALNK